MGNEQSIRDELAATLREIGVADNPQWLHDADMLLASPVIRRIRAEAWFEGADVAVHGYDLPDASDIRNPYIERGETA